MAKPKPTIIGLDENILNRMELLELSAAPIVHLPRNSGGRPTSGRRPTQAIRRINISGSPSTRSSLNSEALNSGEADISQTANHRISSPDGDIWLSGNSLLCTCPDCSAPMTIRLWLQLADCWRCTASITLTESQLRAARQLAQRTAPTIPKPTRNLNRSPQPPISYPPPRVAAPKIGAVPPTASIDPRHREMEELSRGSLAAGFIRNGFKFTPAWMVSFLLHLIVILILALIVMGDRSFLPSTITLSTFLSSDDEEGGDIRIENPLDALQDDLALASNLKLDERELRRVLQKANQDAKKLQVDPAPVVPLPNIDSVKKNITTRPDQLMSFAARDPRVRAEIVRKEGGTTITEAAVARGIRWLASVQNHDGGWSLRDFRLHNQKDNESDIMGTSLALLPMLGAGQTHEYGAYKQNVSAGLAWLLKHQKKNGDLRAGYQGQAGMYAHGQAAIVLCEALALTGDQKFRDPSQRAIQFIESAQHGQGGWRYRPGEEGDTSVFGWQMMALQSARAPDLSLEVDDATLKLADYFLDQVAAPARFDNRRRTQLPDGAAYAYQPGRESTAAMTAEAILCRMYLGWKKDDPRLDSSIKWLIQDHFPSANDPNLYYWYYGTQVMHHYGGEPWTKWNDQMRSLLISTQETRGSYPGSWDPSEFRWGPKGGRIYTTSLAVCTLEVYYRHLPLFKKIELDD
jgi:hypothetical protein